MKRANTDATGFNRNNLNAQAGNDQDVRQGSDAGKSQPTQHAIPTVSVNNDRPTSALPALLIPPLAELASQFASSAPPVQLSASQPVLRGLEAAESAHGSGNGQTDALGSLVLHEPCLTAEQGSDPGAVQALDKHYRNELSAWVESAAPSKRAVHREAETKVNAYLEVPEEQKWLINLSNLDLLTLPPLPAGLRALSVCHSNLSALPERLPSGLRMLNVTWNQLTALPEHLPQGLLALSGGLNKLTVLPKHLPPGLLSLQVPSNRLAALPEYLPPGLQRLHVASNQLTALPEHLPQGLLALEVSRNQLTALPEQLPQGLQMLKVGHNELTVLPEHLPRSLKTLSVSNTRLNAKTLVALMRNNTSITELEVDSLNIDADSKQALDAELVNNREHPARLEKAAVTLDLLTRFGLTTSDQTGTLIKRDSTPSPVADRLPGQSIPHELHHVLSANCPKDVLAVLAGMVDETGQ